MLAPTTWLLTITVSMAPIFGWDVPRRIDVDCDSDRALQRVLGRSHRRGQVDIYLHGICKGNFVITTDGVTLRGATRESGLAAPAGATGDFPVLEIVDAQVTLRGLIVQGGAIGVLVLGRDADVLLFEVDVEGEEGVGVFANRGARVRMIDSTLRDGGIGLLAQSDTEVNLQRVVVNNQRVGVSVSDRSFAALNDTTIENNREAGVIVGHRSDANVSGGNFHENGDVHVSAKDWSSVTLLSGVTMGSDADTTRFALGANRSATIASFTTPVIHGDVSVLVGGSIRLGETVLHGDLAVVQFADAYVRDAEIIGSVVCVDGADAICSRTTTAGVFGCPSPTCGETIAEAAGRAPPVSGFPVVEVPRLELPQRSRVEPSSTTGEQR